MDEEKFKDMIKNYLKDNLSIGLAIGGFNMSSNEVRVSIYLDDEKISEETDWLPSNN